MLRSTNRNWSLTRSRRDAYAKATRGNFDVTPTAV